MLRCYHSVVLLAATQQDAYAIRILRIVMNRLSARSTAEILRVS